MLYFIFVAKLGEKEKKTKPAVVSSASSDVSTVTGSCRTRDSGYSSGKASSATTTSVLSVSSGKLSSSSSVSKSQSGVTDKSVGNRSSGIVCDDSDDDDYQTFQQGTFLWKWGYRLIWFVPLKFESKSELHFPERFSRKQWQIRDFLGEWEC